MIVEHGALGIEENWQMVLIVKILFLLIVLSFIIVEKWTEARQICKIIMVTVEIILMMVHNYTGQDRYFYHNLIMKSIKKNKIK